MIIPAHATADKYLRCLGQHEKMMQRKGSRAKKKQREGSILTYRRRFWRAMTSTQFWPLLD